MKSVLRNKKHIIALVVAFGALGLLIFFSLKSKQTNTLVVPSPTALPSNTWQEIVPGASVFAEINNIFGEPIGEEEGLVVYASQNPNIPNKALFKDDKVILFRRVVIIEDEISVKDLFGRFGGNPTVLYGHEATSGYTLFVYQRLGLAFIGNPITNVVLEVWYFAPTESINEFINKYAKHYSTNWPSPEEGHF